ncbi:MAG TPA: protein kinase, partial [Pyrinomonadaceae bacterium]
GGRPTRRAGRLRGRPAYFWVTITFGVVLVGYYAFAFTTLYRFHGVTKDPGFGYGYWSEDEWRVAGLRPGSEAERVLRVGDRIVAFDGDRRIKVTGPWLRLRALEPGRPFRLTVERDGRELEFTLSAPLAHWSSPPTGVNLLACFVSLVYFALALTLGLLKPDLPAARLASLAAFFQALYIVNPLLQYADGDGFLRGWQELVYFGAYFFHPLDVALAYHFFYRFPPGVRGGRFWSALAVVLYALAAALAVCLRWREFATVQGVDTAVRMFYEHGPLFTQLFRIEDQLLALVFVSIFAVVVRNYRVVRDSDQLRRLRIVTYAAIAYALPPAFALTAGQYYGSIGGPPSPAAQIAFSVAIGLHRLTHLLMPLVIGYAIVRHRVFDINVVVRRGLGYLLARNALRVVFALPVVALALTILSNPHRTLAEILFRNSVFFYLLVAATAATTLKYRHRLTAWLDRKFFRESYDREQILLSLAARVQTCDSLEELSHLVSRQVEAALHPKALRIFYQSGEDRGLTLGYTSSVREEDGAARGIPEDSPLLGLLAREGNSAHDYTTLRRRGLPRNERAWLDALGVDLVVPIAAAEARTPAGLFLLGERLSEEPYSPSDRRLLEGIAAQLSVACENLRLRERMDREQKLRRDVLARLDGRRVNLMRECPACGDCFDAHVETCPRDRRETEPTLPVERTVDGKYRLEKLLGRGGMGAVYEATDLRLSRRVAVKIMIGSLFGDARALRRFQREARTSANLSHPNVVSVFDYGALPAGGAYLVMELARGTTLREELDRAARLSPADCAEVFGQMLDGIGAAHRAGIVHRDLKPDNVLVARAGDSVSVRLLDFGIAKSRVADLADSATHTLPGTVLGTLGYMPPEQLAGAGADERSDLFAVGVMLHESLAGERPFKGRTLLELLHAMHQTRPALPPELAACDALAR